MPEQPIEHFHTILQGNGVLSSEIDSVWDEVKPIIEPAIFENEFSIDEIYKKLKDRDMQLWVVWDTKIVCACISQIDVGKKKYFTIMFIGGERMSAWFEFIHVLEDFAISHGCCEMRTLSRKGFGKLLSQYGFENPLSLFRKKLYG